MDNEVELYFFLERLPNKMRVPSKLKIIRDQELRSMAGDPQMLLFFQYKPQQVSYISQGLKMYTLPNNTLSNSWNLSTNFHLQISAPSRICP